ncbi:MAG: hypothetical protein IKB73_07160 [Ruminococcus sp.]|nr:hypothetical protein [Ruminococcus sp.]
MKKIVSLLLVFVMLMSIGAINTFALAPLYSQLFNSYDEMLSFINDYAQKFPDVDYSESVINAPSDEYWLENKEVVVPVLPEDYATLDAYTCMETRYEGGIACIFSSYTTKESKTNIRFLTYYDMTDDEVDDKIEGLTDKRHPNGVHCGLNDEYMYSAKESTDINGKTRSTYHIAYDDKLIVIYIDECLNTEFVPKIFNKKLDFISTDILLPVYVSGEVNLFEDRFLECYSDNYDGRKRYNHYYEEIFYHYDSDGEMDWVLIDECPFEKKPFMYSAMYKDRILSNGGYYPFSFRYGVYDVNEDKFYNIFENGFDFSKFEGLDEALTAYEPGVPHGDVDYDGILTVMDATFIQRALVGLDEFNVLDDMDYIPELWYQNDKPEYMSDFDRDGERTVMDATAIQMKLAMVPEAPLD